MILTHGLTINSGKTLNYWQDDTLVNLIQEQPDGMYVFYKNLIVKDCGTPQELAQRWGFTLVG